MHWRMLSMLDYKFPQNSLHVAVKIEGICLVSRKSSNEHVELLLGLCNAQTLFDISFVPREYVWRICILSSPRQIMT